jgi:hypothetical protein
MFFQFHESASGPGFDGSEWFAQPIGDLALGETTEEGQINDFALFGRQASHRIPQNLGPLTRIYPR